MLVELIAQIENDALATNTGVVNAGVDHDAPDRQQCENRPEQVIGPAKRGSVRRTNPGKIPVEKVIQRVGLCMPITVRAMGEVSVDRITQGSRNDLWYQIDRNPAKGRDYEEKGARFEVGQEAQHCITLRRGIAHILVRQQRSLTSNDVILFALPREGLPAGATSNLQLPGLL